MAFFGRESSGDQQRIAAFQRWFAARESQAVLSAAFGLFAVVDFWTLVLGVAFGFAAVVLGVRARRNLAQQPHLLGHRLAAAGIAMGVVGIGLSLFMWRVGYPWLASQ